MNSTENGTPRRHISVGERHLARVYAEALLNLAEKLGQVEQIKAELRELVVELVQLEPRFEDFLSSAAIAQKHKEKLIRTTFEGRLHPTLLNFLLLLNENNRLGLLRTISEALGLLHDQRTRRIAVQVQSAVPLNGDQLARLQSDLRSTFNLEPVLQVSIDPDLLGGLVIRVGDWLFDASVRSRLHLLRKQLIASSSYEIQCQRDRFSSDTGN